MSGLAFGLLGSGEFEPWSEAVDRWLLDRATGDGTVLILPTASAAEGEDVFDGWARMGQEHYERLGIPSEVLALKTREDAERPDLVAALERASVAYFSGGNPAYLARVLAGTAFWDTLLREMGRGLAYAGCSAGIACLGEVAPDNTALARGDEPWQTGLRLFPNVYFGPHWDALDSFVPGLRAFIEASVPRDSVLLAVDENTAVVGDGASWSVVGSGGAHLREHGEWRSFPTGSSLEAPLLAADRLSER